MTYKLLIAVLALGSTSIAVSGCATDVTPADAEEDETAASRDELAAAQKKLVGAFHFTSDVPGAAQPGKIRGLVFKADGSFFADVDSGLRCVAMRCMSNPRITGRYTATAKYIRLVADPGSQGSDFFGRYAYTLMGDEGDELTLSRAGAGWKGWSNVLSKKGSYCKKPVDCAGQLHYLPACVGDFSCDQQQNTCSFSCGTGSSSIWPSDATRVVAQRFGGGFTPPPPAGSECAVGAAKYTLDVATKQLAWESCEVVDWQTPFRKVSGTQTLTAAEMAKVDAAMNGLTPYTGNMCGADKPVQQVTVDSASKGSTTYTDNFYACQDRGPYVANIGGVFAAFGEITGS